MKKLKKILSIMMFISMTSLWMTGCDKTNNSIESDSSEMVSDTAEVAESGNSAVQLNAGMNNSEYFSEFDLSTDYNEVTADIQLNGDNVKISGKNAEYNNKIISISSGGTYVISGTLNDGQIYINSDNDENVHLVFNGINIKNSSSSPVYVENAKNTAITLVDGTENILSDTDNYQFSTSEENEPDSVIFSKDDLSFNGNGTLSITANYNEGITTKNDLRISGGKYTINSVGNGIKGKDSVVIQNADIQIDSGEDGIKSTETDQTDKGYIVFENGVYNINAAQDAVQSENFLIINSGEFNVKTGSESTINNNSDTSSQNNNEFIRGGRMSMEGNPNKTENSEKGFKSSKTITINNGSILADCTDDCIHAAENIEINNGNFTLNSNDDAIHSDSTFSMNDGTVNIEKSYEGIEAVVINVNGGEINIKSEDDGFNASDGTGDSMGGMMSASPSCELNFNGGKVYVNADGDGLDSNGVININDGTIIVDGPVNDGNGALDSGTEINVNGGILAAAGSSGMAEVPSDSSKQNSIAVTLSQSNPASTLIYILDGESNVIAACMPSKEYSSIIISTPDIKTGMEYSIYSGGSAGEDIGNKLSSGVKCSGGELIETITVSEIVSYVGTGTIGQRGGMMKPGGFDHGEDDDNNFKHDKDFENMTPPDNNGNDFGNMTPPDNNGNDFGNITPPDNNGMEPPQGMERDFPDGNNSFNEKNF